MEIRVGLRFSLNHAWMRCCEGKLGFGGVIQTTLAQKHRDVDIDNNGWVGINTPPPFNHTRLISGNQTVSYGDMERF